MTSDGIKKIGNLVKQKILSALKPIDDKLDNHTTSLMEALAKNCSELRKNSTL